MNQGPHLRVLVTGAGGQLGAALLEQAPEDWVVHGLAHGDCDISDETAVVAALAGTHCDVLVNAAAYTAVDRAEDEAEQARSVNAHAPGVLASACAAAGVRLLHVSTDFVFDGAASTPYTPDSTAAPLGVYGDSKLAGERAVAAAGADSLILRTSWVYSHRGQNFLTTMLRLHATREEISVVDDQVGTPTSAASLADVLWAIAAAPALQGIWHYSDAGVCSWYDFAVAIGEEALALGVLENTATVLPIPSSSYPTRAQRPAYSVLDSRATREALMLPPRHWRAQLREALARVASDRRETTHG